MGSIRFTYDDNELKEIKIVSVDEGDEIEDVLDTIKIFCLDSIPKELNCTVKKIEKGFLVTCDSSIGKDILTHIFKYVYLVSRAAIVFKEEFANGTIDANSLDLEKLKSDIERVSDMDYKELAKLIGEVEDVAG